jgi:valyl-tRNA synthetase
LGQNLRYSTTEVEMGHKTAVKLYNVGRFVGMHLDAATAGDGTPEAADTWIVQECNATIHGVNEAFDAYDFARARDVLDRFFWSKFTDYYVEFIKYRLFGDDANSKAAAASTVRQVFQAILKMYAPIMPFITEEMYHQLDGFGDGASIHRSPWPERIDLPAMDIDDFDTAIAAIDEIRKYKALHSMSLGKELPSYQLQTPVDLVKYGELIRRVGRINSFTATD